MPSAIRWNRIGSLLLGMVLISCVSDEDPVNVPHSYEIEYPTGFPEMDFPEDNPLTVEAVELGRLLFYDPLMSEDYSVSCASCHLQEYAFADTVPVSMGVHEDRMGRRNSPSLANVGYQKALFMEGGVPSLELQVLAPLGERSEMDLQIRDAVKRMKEDEHYVDLARRAYDREIDPWVITHALAAFERTLISGDSPFDKYYYQGDEDAISQEAKNGWERFQAFNCNACHSGFLFTNEGYFNIGLEEEYTDPGRARLTDDPSDHGKFKVPSLRNVALTAPYMHDGSMATLDEVIAHFASGGKDHPNKSFLINGLEISEEGKQELIAFLESLTDKSFVFNKEYQP